MQPPFKVLFFLFAVFFTPIAFGQYTETINSNRPGESQGAFAVGVDVIQLEAGVGFGKDEHELLNTESTLYSFDYALRYGLLWEQLEVSLIGSYLYTDEIYLNGIDEEYTYGNFDRNTIGAKYLVYDPYKTPERINIRSWKANRRFKWKTLIPAVSVYAGANIMLGDNPYMFQNESSFSPKLSLITQNNWGRWVFVMNFIVDKITEDFPTYAGIFTMTHSLNPNLAVFGEYQVIKSDFYSDNIVRTGAAYLFSDNFQVDVSALFNYKDTPVRWKLAAGISYRLDLHTEDVILEDKEAKRKREKEQKRMERILDLEEPEM